MVKSTRQNPLQVVSEKCKLSTYFVRCYWFLLLLLLVLPLLQLIIISYLILVMAG